MQTFQRKRITHWFCVRPLSDKELHPNLNEWEDSTSELWISRIGRFPKEGLLIYKYDESKPLDLKPVIEDALAIPQKQSIFLRAHRTNSGALIVIGFAYDNEPNPKAIINSTEAAKIID